MSAPNAMTPSDMALTYRTTMMELLCYPTEQCEPFWSHHGTVAALSTRLLDDTNLETSAPNAYRIPPEPPPSDGNQYDATVHTTNIELTSSSKDTPVEREKSGELKKSTEGVDLREAAPEGLSRTPIGGLRNSSGQQTDQPA